MRGVALLALLAVLLGLSPAQAQEAGGRLVKVTQVDADGATIGSGIEVFCPVSGCQEPITVTIEGSKETYIAAIDVVSRGVYLALTSRTIGTDSILDFETGRPGPTFVTTRGRERVVKVLRYTIVRDASVRAERGFDPKRQVTEGPVFNRSRVPDLLLHVEVLTPEQ